MRRAIIVLSIVAGLTTSAFAETETAPKINSFDLTSTTRSLPPGDLVKSGPLEILVGGEKRSITAESLLTPAEKVAAQQVSQSGRQSLKLSAMGSAIGGSFIIGPDFAEAEGNWIIPREVSALKQTPAPGRVPLPVEAAIRNLSRVMTDTNRDTVVKYLPNARVIVGESRVVQVDSGEALVAATKATTVRAGKYDITVRPGAGVLIALNGDLLSVRPLFENADKSVRVQFGQRFAELSAGQELLVAPNFREASRLLRADQVARRQIRNFDTPDGTSYMRSEIQLISVAQNSKLLAAIMSSHQAGDKSLSAKVVKMAACLAQTKGRKGSYSPLK
jgi:hypothetical protein